VSDSFWVKAINMVCHASNGLYLSLYLEEDPYESLIGRKPNISYFRLWLQVPYFEEGHKIEQI
jgi:hypothetical protein